jgi:hypothetical protein
LASGCHLAHAWHLKAAKDFPLSLRVQADGLRQDGYNLMPGAIISQLGGQNLPLAYRFCGNIIKERRK